MIKEIEFYAASLVAAIVSVLMFIGVIVGVEAMLSVLGVVVFGFAWFLSTEWARMVSVVALLMIVMIHLGAQLL